MTTNSSTAVVLERNVANGLVTAAVYCHQPPHFFSRLDALQQASLHGPTDSTWARQPLLRVHLAADTAWQAKARIAAAGQPAHSSPHAKATGTSQTQNVSGRHTGPRALAGNVRSNRNPFAAYQPLPWARTHLLRLPTTARRHCLLLLFWSPNKNNDTPLRVPKQENIWKKSGG